MKETKNIIMLVKCHIFYAIGVLLLQLVGLILIQTLIIADLSVKF